MWWNVGNARRVITTAEYLREGQKKPQNEMLVNEQYVVVCGAAILARTLNGEARHDTAILHSEPELWTQTVVEDEGY
jgi:hypothetical protein